MGLCSGKVLSQSVTGNDLITVTGLRYATIQRNGPSSSTGSETGLAKERTQLLELLDAQSKGLIFTKRVFSVLPGVSTLADVTLRISCQPGVMNEETTIQDDDNKVFQFRLAGYGVVVGLSLSITVKPRVGPLAGKLVSCWWENDTFYVRGGGRSHSFAFVAHANRLFSSVQEFCKMCVHVVHQAPDISEFHEFDESNQDDQPENAPIQVSQPQLLSQLALRTLLCSLDVIPAGVLIPTAYLPEIYRGYKMVEVILHLWPSSLHNQKGCKITTLDGLMYCEFSYMVMLRYGISPGYQLKWYENFKPVLGKQQISTNSKRIDCFVVNTHSEDVFYSEEKYIQTAVPIIISLVGFEVKDLYVNPSMTIKDLDKRVRQLFGLKSNSFLVLLPEGDLSPHYSRNDQWKCVYPMSIGGQTPRRLFGSSSNLSVLSSGNESHRRNGSTGRSNYRSRNGSVNGSPQHQSVSNYWLRSQPLTASNYGQSAFYRSMSSIRSTNSPPSPLALATKLLSNSSRNFPMHQNIHGLSIEEVYQMPMYSYNLERYGIYGHSVVQVFEVTGPTVPIAFCGSTAGAQNTTATHHKIRSINLMDINPAWPIPTLTQYVEAIICPRQAVTQKKITLGENSLVDSVDVMKLKVSEILDIWKPIWWRSKVSLAAKLSLKDITPKDVLTIENINQ